MNELAGCFACLRFDFDEQRVHSSRLIGTIHCERKDTIQYYIGIGPHKKSIRSARGLFNLAWLINVPGRAGLALLLGNKTKLRQSPGWTLVTTFLEYLLIQTTAKNPSKVPHW